MGYLAGLAGEGGAGAGGMAAAGDAGMGASSAGMGSGLSSGMGGAAGIGDVGGMEGGMAGAGGMGAGAGSNPSLQSQLYHYDNPATQGPSSAYHFGEGEPAGGGQPSAPPGPASPARAGMFQMEKGKSPADIAANMISGAIKGKATTPMTLPSMPQRRGGAGSAPPPGLGSFTSSLQRYQPRGSGGTSLSDLLSQLAQRG